MTPIRPPSAQTAKVCQNGIAVHQPMIIRPGSTKTTDDKVPAEEATV